MSSTNGADTASTNGSVDLDLHLSSIPRDLRTLLLLAFGEWIHRDEPESLDLLIGARDLVEYEPAKRLLEIVGRARDAGKVEFDDVLADIDDRDVSRIYMALCDGALMSATGFRRHYEQLVMRRFAPHLEGLAKNIVAGHLDAKRSLDAMAEIEDQIRRVAGDAAEDDELLRTILVNDPSTEESMPAPEWVIEGRLHPGVTMLSGPWKSGKTWLALYMTAAIATGTDFFGAPARRKKVAWLESDMGEHDIVHYGRLLREGMGYPAEPIVVYPSAKIDIANPAHQKRLARDLEARGIEVLVIDSARSSSKAKENESDEIRAVSRDFIAAELRDRLGMAVLVLAHAAKNGQQGTRGSGEWDAAADSLIYVSAGKEGGIKVRMTGRHAPDEYAYAVDDLTEFDGGVRLRELDASDVRDAGKESSSVDEVSDAIADIVRAAPISERALVRDLRVRGVRLANKSKRAVIDAAIERHPRLSRSGTGVLVWDDSE